MDEHQRGQVATAAAEIYERFFVPALFAEWPGHVLAAAGVGPGDRVLDVACGTGVLARAAADRVGGDRVVGIDVIDDNGFEMLRREAPQRLSRFVLEDGSVAFDAPAHIVTASAG